ncbi:MAG: FAD-dependent oxidoreductase [Candidatus Methanomethylicaceae archaeon]
MTGFVPYVSNLNDRTAVYEATRCLMCFDAPCVSACPTGINIPEFIYRIKTGNFYGAAKVIRESNIFGGECGYVCPVECLCESKCVRKNLNEEPVVISMLQRFAFEKERLKGLVKFPQTPPKKKKVAVVGAGPAGLSAAYELARMGYGVTVFDSNPKPGGIDAHTHMEMPFMGTTTVDDFEYGTIAAAFGGVTTILDFAIQPKDKSFLDTVSIWRGKADPKVVIDYGIHVVVTNLTEDLVNEIPKVLDAVVSSFKLFMPYRKEGLMSDDGKIFRMLEESRRLGFLVQLHAENNAILELLIDRHVSTGCLSAEYHAKSRPNFVEGEAVYRGLAMAAAAGGNLYIVHMSTKEGVAELARMKTTGANVYGETCPHYLTLTYEKYLSPKGRRYIMSPPLRSKADNDALWAALADGTLSTVATDHCTFTDAQKDLGKDNFTKSPQWCSGY